MLNVYPCVTFVKNVPYRFWAFQFLITSTVYATPQKKERVSLAMEIRKLGKCLLFTLNTKEWKIAQVYSSRANKIERYCRQNPLAVERPLHDSEYRQLVYLHARNRGHKPRTEKKRHEIASANAIHPYTIWSGIVNTIFSHVWIHRPQIQTGLSVGLLRRVIICVPWSTWTWNVAELKGAIQ